MGTPVERQNLSFPFFVLSTLIAVATAWSFYDEFVVRRPWRDYQAKAFAMEQKKLKGDVAYEEKRLASEETQKALKQLKDELAAAERDLVDPAKQAEREQLVARRLPDLEIEVSDADIKVKFLKSEMDGVYYKFREARHQVQEAKDEAARKVANDEYEELAKEMKSYEDRIAQAQQELDKKTEARDQVKKQVEDFQGKVASLRKDIVALESPVDDAKAKLVEAQAKGPELTQYWLRDLNTVDRCQNCHAAIDRCGFSQPFEVADALKAGLTAAVGDPAKEEAARKQAQKQFCVNPDTLATYASVQTALCEGDPAVPAADAKDLACVGEAEFAKWTEKAALYCGPGKKLVERWVAKDKQLCMAPEVLKSVNETLAQADFDLPRWAMTHPHKSELLGNNHPAETFGCTACHGGEGPQTKGIGSHEFEHGYDDHYWEKPLLDLVSYTQASTGKKLEHQKQMVQSSCARCHAEDINLKYADDLMKGRKLVMEIGCYGCHPVEPFNNMRKPGPRLTAVKEKLDPGFLVKWIKYPRAFRSRTRMPSFWPEAVDEKGQDKVNSPAWRTREDEATAIAAYLWTTSEGQLETPRALASASAENGRKLVQDLGCYACHAFEPGDKRRSISGSEARDFAPDLSNVGAKTSATWIYHWLKNPSAYWTQTRMPNLRLSDSEAADISKYLAGNTEGLSFEAPVALSPGHDPAALGALADKGKGLIQKYGCFGCHDIKGFEDAQRIGAQLDEFGVKPVDLLDFGDAITDPHEQTWYNWVDRKLRFPRSYKYERVDARMPQFDFTDEEVRVLMVFLKSLQQEKTPPSLLAGRDSRRAAVFSGEKLVEFYNCRGCHIVNDRGGVIRDRYQRTDAQGNVVEDFTALAPPILNGEGAKVQPTWLFHFLRGPTTIRPWLKVRMPTFPLNEEQATGIVHYFAAYANKSFPYIDARPAAVDATYLAEAGKMFGTLQCLKCHTAGEPAPGTDPAQLAPNLELAKNRLRPDWIPLWLTDPQAVQPNTRMPGFFPDGQSPLPGFFGGNAKKQMEALRDYIMHLPSSQPTVAKRTTTANR